MKLLNSVTALRNQLLIQFDPMTEQVKFELLKMQRREEPYQNVVNFKTAARFFLWFRIPKEIRDEIIEKSVPRSEWVGGYPDVNDDHRHTLLRKVMDSKFMAKLAVECELTSLD